MAKLPSMQTRSISLNTKKHSGKNIANEEGAMCKKMSRRERDLRWLKRLKAAPSIIGEHRRKKIEGVECKNSLGKLAFWGSDIDEPPLFSRMFDLLK